MKNVNVIHSTMVYTTVNYLLLTLLQPRKKKFWFFLSCFAEFYKAIYIQQPYSVLQCHMRRKILRNQPTSFWYLTITAECVCIFSQFYIYVKCKSQMNITEIFISEPQTVALAKIMTLFFFLT